MDSGASAPVAPPEMAPHVPIEPSPGSKRGQKSTTATKDQLLQLDAEIKDSMKQK